MQWLAVVGFTEQQFQKRDYDKMMEHHLNIGLADYCGVEDSHVHFAYNTLGEFDSPDEAEPHFARLHDDVYELGRNFGETDQTAATDGGLLVSAATAQARTASTIHSA